MCLTHSAEDSEAKPRRQEAAGTQGPEACTFSLGSTFSQEGARLRV